MPTTKWGPRSCEDVITVVGFTVLGRDFAVRNQFTRNDHLPVDLVAISVDIRFLFCPGRNNRLKERRYETMAGPNVLRLSASVWNKLWEKLRVAGATVCVASVGLFGLLPTRANSCS